MSTLRNSLLLLTCFCLSSLSAQTYLDAIVLDSVVQSQDAKFDLSSEKNIRKVATLLKPYLPEGSLPEDSTGRFRAGALFILLKNQNSPAYNPILADLIPTLSGTANSTTVSSAPGGGLEGLAVSGGLGGLPVTNIVDGVARFLVQRTRQEINLTFFRHFYEALNDPVFLELRTLYPQTYQIFNTIDQDIYRYAYFTESMQEAFRKDLQTVPLNFNRLIHLPKYDSLFAQPFHQSMASLALTTSQELVSGSDPRTMIHNIAYSEEWQADSTVFNLRSSFQVLDLLAGGMQDGQRWLKRENLNQLLRTDNRFALKIFMGLLYAGAKGINFQLDDGSKMPLQDFLVKLDDEEDDKQIFRRYVRNFGEFAVDIQAQLDNIREGREDNLTMSDGYYSFASSFIAALEEGVAFKNALGLEGGYDQNFLQILGHVNSMNLDLHLKNYSSAVVNLVQALQSSLVGVQFEQKNELLRYSSFIAVVAQATTSDEIAYAIEAVALPVGSASIKKYSQWNLSLNAYVGGFYGLEYLEGRPDDQGQIYGIAAPIGIAVSRGISPMQDHGSITFFASLVDIGAVTAFRFQDPFTEQLPEIKLENIFAPGAYLIYGFPKWPLSIGAGYQQGPQLRRVEIDQNTFVDANGYRVSAFLAVDIPIFNFYTSAN
ncbi:MAG: hypothetical protein AAFQ87_01040 [Bacteroidota bacterium]